MNYSGIFTSAMAKPTFSSKSDIKQTMVFCCFWAFLTGVFFALPSLPFWVGLVGIVIAIAYCGLVCLLGRSFIWISIGLTAVLTVAYNIITSTNFSVINYAVWMTISLNFVIFGFGGVSLRKKMSVWRSWLITAGAFGGALGLGWLFSLIFS